VVAKRNDPLTERRRLKRRHDVADLDVADLDEG
jgi:hypothetical protein